MGEQKSGIMFCTNNELNWDKRLVVKILLSLLVKESLIIPRYNVRKKIVGMISRQLKNLKK